MDKFTRVTGIAAPFPRPNIDTDAIIPAQWLRSVSADLGKGLFGGWRYDTSGAEIPDFILNREPYRRAKIILGGPNFGCGSSREGAVWALLQFGVRCVIAPSFSDIFFENAFKNGLLPVILPQADVDNLFAYLKASNDPTLTVDLERCLVQTPQGGETAFAIPEARRTSLLEGLDEIGQTLRHDSEIGDLQAHDRVARPWIHDRPHGLIERARG